MKLQRVARRVLGITAIAWGIPLAQAEEGQDLKASAYGKFSSLQDRAYLGRVTDDSMITAKVKAALLKEQQLKSLNVSVETYRGEVLLSGFVQDDAQRKKAVQVASAVSGVTKVKDGLAVR